MTQDTLFEQTIMRRAAEISPDGAYRYTLLREWNSMRPRILFCMLNPSTADHTQDDPTIRRIIKLARDRNYGSLTVVNLFALRSPSPDLLYIHKQPVGEHNDYFIHREMREAKQVVVAWGNHGRWLDRDRAVLRMIRQITQPFCLGLTNTWMPKHPLSRGRYRIPDNVEFISYEHR